MRKLCFAIAMAAALACAQPRGRESGHQEDRAYERGQRALDRQLWAEALEAFTQAASGGSRADGASYWKAYALNKLGRRDEALAALETLRKEHANSRWLDDAKALELELRQAAGQKPRPEAEADTEMKLMALNALMRSDPERAVPYLEKILKSSADPKLKERALFVLAQSSSPKAGEMLARIARGNANPDVQLKAITYLSVMGGKAPDRLPLLSEIYASASDARVKRAILQGFMIARARDRLLDAARNEKDAGLRHEAMNMLGAAGGTAELWTLYRSLTDSEDKKRLINGLFVGRDVDHIIEIARTETDPESRRKAIQMLGLIGGEKALPALTSIYGSIDDMEARRAVIDALMMKGGAKPLVELARKETNPELKRRIVERLSHMRSKEATDYMMELLNK